MSLKLSLSLNDVVRAKLKYMGEIGKVQEPRKMSLEPKCCLCRGRSRVELYKRKYVAEFLFLSDFQEKNFVKVF